MSKSRGSVVEDPFREHYEYLVQKMDEIPQILDKLYTKGVVNKDKMHEIRVLPNRSKQAREILDYVDRRPDDELPKFVEVLRETGNGHLADIIDRYIPKPEDTPTPPPPYVRSPTPPPPYEQVQSPPPSPPKPISPESVGTISPENRVLTPTQHRERILTPTQDRERLLTPSQLRSKTPSHRGHGHGNRWQGQWISRTPACTPVVILGVIAEKSAPRAERKTIPDRTPETIYQTSYQKH